MRLDPIIDYAYSIEDQSQPGHESLRRALVMAILLRDGGDNPRDAELYAIAAHPCALTQHLLITHYLGHNAISQLGAPEVRPLGLADETLIELKILAVLPGAEQHDQVRALTRAAHLSDNMVALALWATTSEDDLERLGETLARRLSPTEPMRLALWATWMLDHAASDRRQRAAAVVAKLAPIARQWRQQRDRADAGHSPTPFATLAMWCRALDIAIDAALTVGAPELAELWAMRLTSAAALEHAPDRGVDADEALRFLQAARTADLTFARDVRRRPSALREGPFVPWRDHATALLEPTVGGSAADRQAAAAHWRDPYALRRLALHAELAHQDLPQASELWRAARRRGLPTAASLIHELRLAYLRRDWATMHQHYLTWAEGSQDATEVHAAWVGAAVTAMRTDDASLAGFCWAAAQDAAPSPIAAFAESLLRRPSPPAIRPHPVQPAARGGALLDQPSALATALADSATTIASARAPELLERQLAHAGDVAMQNQQPAEAAAHYRRLVEAFPDHPRYVRDLHRALEGAGAWRELVHQLEDQATRGLAAGDRHAGVGALLAAARLCEERLRDAPAAAARYQRVLQYAEDDATRATTLDALARIYETTGAWQALIETTVEQVPLTKHAPDKALLWFRCGSVVEFRLADASAAEPYYKRALAASATCMPALHSLRELYRARGDWRTVVEMLRLEAAQWPQDEDRAGVFAQIGTIYRDQLHDTASAIAAFMEALALDPDCIAANLAMLDYYLSNHRWNESRDILDRMDMAMVRHATPAEKAGFACQCAKLALHDRNLDDAAFWLARALQQDPACELALELLIDAAERAATGWSPPESLTEQLVEPIGPSAGSARRLTRRNLALAWIALHAANLPAAASLTSAAQAAAKDATVADAFAEQALARLWHRIAAS